ncbi:uncharacterized protein LOC123566607 [Mercenaria mercenaria]|uniref:uncharacterized protein LOC123566607 n=1 Tax=Mercenaria mercenaria TaxID=6596 RepID=UPI00234ECB6C|nr:uncharacterized protein LOC123566607 [Mercenaria mercenaria]
MASSEERGTMFSLNVKLSASPKEFIPLRMRMKIFKHIESQLPLYQKHMHAEENDFFDVNGMEEEPKYCMKLKFSVFDEEGLSRFFEYSRISLEDGKSRLSNSLTSFFHQQNLQLEFEFGSKTKINILVGMSEEERMMVADKLAEQEETTHSEERSIGKSRNEVSHSSNMQSPQDKRVRMTFIIDVPEDKDVTSVKIKCRSIEALNCEMYRNERSRSIYSADIELPAQYDPDADYSYEISFKNSVFYLVKWTSIVTSSELKLQNKTVHRDILSDKDSIVLHLLDLVHSVSERYSETELCMQIEDICRQGCNYDGDVERILRALLKGGVLHSHKCLIRFALVVGKLCQFDTGSIYKTIDSTIAQEILNALSQERLADFPTSCSDYMPALCKHLFEISYKKDFCVLEFLKHAFPFLGEDLVLLALQDYVSNHEKFVNDNPYCNKLANDLCRSFYMEFIGTGSQAFKEIIEYLFRHLPLEMTLQSYGQLIKLPEYETDEIIQREEDAHIAITASIKSQILYSCKTAVKEKKVISLLKLASAIGKFERLCNDKIIRTNIEEGVMTCFSSHSLKETTELEQEVQAFLQMSACFLELESQLLLLTCISDSTNSAVRRLFIVLNREHFFDEAYGCLDIDVYKSWLLNEIKTHQTQNEDELLYTFRTLCEMLKLPIMSERAEITKELELVTMNFLKRYTLKEMLYHIEKIEHLCGNETAVSYLYKEQVKGRLKNKGYTPTEVLGWFCPNGSLRVNSKTTGDIVCTVIDLFFENSAQDTLFDSFISQIPHVAFWQLIVDGEGSRLQDVKNNATYKQVIFCVKQVAFLLKNGEVDISFMSKLNVKDENTKRTLILGGMQKKDIEAMQTSFKKVVEKVTQDIKNVIAVLEEVQIRRSNTMIPKLSALLENTKLMKAKIESGSLSVKESSSVGWLWGDLGDLPEICRVLHPVIKSNVFWNVSRKAVLASFLSSLQSGTTLDGLVSIRYLFDADTDDNDVQEIRHAEQIVRFLKILKTEGIELFEKHWTYLETDNTIPMQYVLEMFENAKIPDEIKIADTFLQRRIKNTVKETLSQLWRKNEVLKTAQAMTSVLEVFGYDISKDNEVHLALKSFEEVTQQNISDCTLLDVQKALQTVFSLADALTGETVYIMTEIGKSSLLIKFLKQIAIEDVRNLIDAVEDIFESHVQESTVSALIEAKRFLQPLLLTSATLQEKGSRWIFKTLQKQTNSLGENAGSLPGKISDCFLNLNNLKSLYNNVANRGQQTKEVIKNIITKGRFVFMLCTEQDRVMFEVSYKENKNRFSKQEATISDIRSRALLLLNSERQCTESTLNQVDFRRFIESVDLCLEIRDLLNNLFSSGHIRYKSFKLSLQSEQLQQTKDRLKGELDDWMISIHHARNKYYLMNFIQGCQIRVISDFLEKGSGRDVVEAVLKYIHPNLNVLTLSATFRKDMCLLNESLMLDELGRSLHEMYANSNRFMKNMKCEDYTTKMTKCVNKGKVLVAQLDEKSGFVIRTVLALYRNTTQQFPEPNQLLFCTKDTTWDEINLLLQRCKGSYCFYESLPLYCLANVELLPNEVQFRLVEELQTLRGRSDFLFAIVCRGSKNHPFMDQLNDNVVTVQPVSNQAIENLFHAHHPNVFTFTSEVAGLGKSTHICRKSAYAGRSTVTLHISGQVRKSTLIANLNELNVRDFHTLHLDIGVVDEPGELDTFLFELVVLKFVASGKLAFSMPTEHIYFEISNTINNVLRNNLTTVTSFKREHLLWNDFSDFICSQEINSHVQVVCHYLQALMKGRVDNEELCFSGKKALKPLTAGECRTLLKTHLNIASNISFAIVHIFLNVLSDQLKKLSYSAFFKVSRISEMIGKSTVPTVRSSLVKAMIDVSMEFAARSVNACRSTQSSTLESDIIGGANDKVDDDLVGKIIKRADGMIRWEESNHLIYVFHNQNIHTLSPMYRDKDKVPDHIRELFERQIKRTLPDFSAMNQVELQNMLQRVARTNPTSLQEEKLRDMSKDYALTPDNLLKMVLIMMRVQSKVPILIMGETGCGKTSLIRYLACICEVPFRVINIHAGLYKKEIVDIVMEENEKSLNNVGTQRWLFLDEINTSENIGLICDIICHHRCITSILSPNLVIMGACNPYKLRTVEAIHTAGLTGKVKTDELSKLVYRVLPLPEMMVDYVWDFGSLNENDELKYIQRMVEGVFENGSREHVLFSDLLSISQTFVRKTELSTCVVSLRDVQRCKTLVHWFMTILKIKSIKENFRYPLQLDIGVKAIILALAHCYHSRFSNKSVRSNYRRELLEGFERNKFTCISKETDIHDIIIEEQKDILDRMDLPHGTAKNTALQENVFVILVCILNKIPVFVVGKPGCSKSLAMQVIRSNLRGKDSRDEFFKRLPQLYCVSFQGSESSTSDGIIKVFEKAENYQKSSSKDSVLSVVILDEIGLAEISRFNPLKVLHNLLESEGRSQPNVAVVGISNWALDASKMNRAVHLSRPDMDEEELFGTAMSISNSLIESIQVHEGFTWIEKTKRNTLSLEDIEEELRLVVKSYIAYTKKLQFKNFHGLRDFYSLVKFIARKLAEDYKSLTSQKKSAVIIEGLLRNFGGLKSGRQLLFDHFTDCFQNTAEVRFTSVELIGSNIGDKIARHLMIITEGESVLGILEQNLRDTGRGRKEIIFGSQFEEDLTDDYNYRILSRIILCMEQGIVLVLKDLENIYGSLYDMLNQNYTRIGKKNNCRVALGPYSNPFCHVEDTFRCIVLVDESKVDYTDPPFLNRFEKQILSFADVMDYEESNLVSELEKWIESITTIEGKPFSKCNALPYYKEELIISLVLFFKRKTVQSDIGLLLEKCKTELLWMLRPEVIVRLSHVDNTTVRHSSEQMKNIYFQLPLHGGLRNLIKYQINEDKHEQMTVVFTSSNIHTKIAYELNSWRYQSERLGAFKSEKQLSIKLEQFWDNPDMQILLVHCSAREDDKHIMLTKSLIEKYSSEYLEKSDRACFKLVYLIVHLGCRDSQLNDESTRSLSQMNYLSGWKLLLLENLECPKTSLPVFCSKSLLDTIEDMLPLTDVLKEELFWAFTRIQYGVHGRDAESINNVIDKVNNSDDFLRYLGEMIWSYIRDSSNGQNDADWFVRVACDTHALNTSAFLIDALEHQIRCVIKITLAKIIFKLEHIGAIDSYFVEDGNSIERKTVWYANMKNEKIFSYHIEGKPIKDATGPECYQCDTPDLALKLPFSRIIFEKIEETKDLFTDEVSRSKLKCDLDTDDNLPEEIMGEIILQQESFILKRLSDILEFDDTFEMLNSDYVIDFCNLYSYTLSSVLDRDTRIEYMIWIIEQKTNLDCTDSLRLLTSIHCTCWSHMPVFGSVIQLLELCANVFIGESSNVLTLFKQAIKNNTSFGSAELGSNDSQKESELLSDSNSSVLQSNDGLKREKQNDSMATASFDKMKYVDEELKQKHIASSNATDVEYLYEHKENADELKRNSGYNVENNDFCRSETNGMSAQESFETFQNKTLTENEQSNIENFTQDHRYIPLDNTCKNEHLKCESETNTPPKDHVVIMFTWSGDSIQDLVSFVCSRMIPTTANFSQFTGLKHWQIAVRNILIVAAEVSTDSEALHALRLCNDIATDLVMPYDLNITSLQNVGNSLLSSSVDSYEVFLGVLNMFRHVQCAESSANVQRIISQFLIRCLSVNTDTTAYTYMLNAILESSIPEDNLQLLKAPLNFILQQELGEKNNLFREVLVDSNENDNLVRESGDFLSALDSCVHTLFIQGRIESPFVLLIVDLLQEMFDTDDEREKSYDLILTSGKVLQDNYIGLAFIAAVAYLKAAIWYVTGLISNSDQTDTSSLLIDLNAVFSGLGDIPIHKSLLEYFLKGLGNNSAICTVMKDCSNMSGEYPFLQSVVWTEGYLSKTLEGNPLALDVPIEMLHEGESYMAIEQSTESYKTSMLNLMNLSAKASVSGLLLLYSLVVKKYYLPRYRGMLNDIERSRAAILLEHFQKHQHSVEQQTLMECALGKRDFLVSHFMHGEESSFQQYLLNSIFVSCFARSLCCCEETEGQPLSYLKRCLLKPLQLKSCFLPGFPDRTNTALFEMKKTVIKEGSVFAMCACNRRLLYRTQETTLICFVCRKEIPHENTEVNVLCKTSHHVPSPGLRYKPHMVEMQKKVRKLSDFSSNVLQLIVKGCLLGSVALGISNDADLEELISDTSSEINVSSRIEIEIYNHWKKLKEMMNMDDHDVAMFLHSILIQGRQLLFEERNAFVNATDRELWENKFETVISDLLDDRIHTIQHSIISCNSLYNLPDDLIEVVIREANDLQITSKQTQHEQLPSLFKISVKPSKTDFLCQLWRYRKTYPFLAIFLKQETQLKLLKHIHHILQWHMVTVVNANYSFKRNDCLNMTVREFHNSLTDQNKRKRSTRKFENFRSSWSTVKKALEKSEGFETLLHINFDTKMNDCLILDTHCDIYKVLSFLINTQNDFIDTALQLSFSCKNLQFLLRDSDTACFKCVPVTELEMDNLIDASFNWEETLAQESNSGLGYGLGKQVHYDFCNIEKELSVDLLVRKAYINLEALPKIVFTDELYRNFVTLLADVHHSIPQESLPNDLEVSFMKTNKDIANMSLELINYLDMILTLIKKVKCDKEKSLSEFVKERINILGQFPSHYLPSPENRVKICHIISLHELLEELSVDRIIGSLGEAYNTDLGADIEDHFAKMAIASLRKSECVLKTIKRFIYRCIFMGNTDPEQPLLQFLCHGSFWSVSVFKDGKLKIDDKEEDIKDIILPDVLVCHVVSLVSLLHECIETQKQGELRMDHVITSWKSKGETSTKVTRQRKAVKKLRKT